MSHDHDLFHSQRTGALANQDPWRLEKSSYRKLRIDGAAVKTLLDAQRLRVTHEEAQRNR